MAVLRSGERKKHATIIDVAETAGVAVGTVSRYLNGLPVRNSNRHPIEDAIKALGFRRSAVAVSMKTQTTDTIGLMIPAFSEFHASLHESLARRLRQTGRALICYSHDRDPVSIAHGLEFFARHRVDAVVMDGDEGGRSVLQHSVEDGTVLVLYDHDLPGIRADRVFMENVKSSKRLVDHLVDLGHKKIATVHGLLENTGGRERLDGYLQSLRGHSVPIREDYIVPGYWMEDGGYAAIRDLMSLQEPPTALFGANYLMTIGALRWLREHDFVVPRDLSIVSFDDVPAFSVHTAGITAVAQPTERFAEAIAQLLDERLSPTPPPQRRTLRIGGNVTLRGSAVRSL
ncbi:MAG: LacI family DNA-binding transcriptional regulator [Devosia sp.]